MSSCWHHSSLAKHDAKVQGASHLGHAADGLTHIVGSRQEVQQQGGVTHVGQDGVVEDHQHLFIQVTRQLEHSGWIGDAVASQHGSLPPPPPPPSLLHYLYFQISQIFGAFKYFAVAQKWEENLFAKRHLLEMSRVFSFGRTTSHICE